MSKVLKVRRVHKISWKGIGDEDGYYRYNINLRHATVQRPMGRDPLVIVGRRTLKIKRFRLLDGNVVGPRKRYRMVCELLHTAEQ